MREAAVALAVGGEFEAFRPRYAFWAPVLMLRTLSLVLAKIFFTSMTAVQLVAALMIIVMSIMAQLRWQPYADEKMNALETLFLASSALVLALGTMLQTATFADTEAVDSIGWAVFVIVLLNALVVAVWLLWELAYQLRLRHRAVGTKEEIEMLYELFAAERIQPIHLHAIDCSQRKGEQEAFFAMLGEIANVAQRFDDEQTPVPHKSPTLTLLDEFTLRAFHSYNIGAVLDWLRTAKPSDQTLFRASFVAMAKRTYANNGKSLGKKTSRLLSRLGKTRAVDYDGNFGLGDLCDLLVRPVSQTDLVSTMCRQADFVRVNQIGRTMAEAVKTCHDDGDECCSVDPRDVMDELQAVACDEVVMF